VKILLLFGYEFGSLGLFLPSCLPKKKKKKKEKKKAINFEIMVLVEAFIIL